jgi:glycosyltransferase involved in cell wall biosynthesis
LGFVFCTFEPVPCCAEQHYLTAIHINFGYNLHTLIYTVLISAFLLAAALQLGYLLLLRVPQSYTEPEQVDQPVSVIICARNEAQHLRQLLPAVLQQEYPSGQWEVILVDDGSTDDTASVLETFRRQYAHLVVVTLAPGTIKDIPGKKFALSKGIAAAKYDRLLLTDADCRPASSLWLRKMTMKGKAIVLGYGAYETLPGLLNRFIRWETVNTCMQYAGYAAWGLPYMGVGRNLCYNKPLLTALEKDAAFQAIYRNTPSGDDDLLIGRIASQDNTTACLSPGAHTLSAAPVTWQAWWRQKTRHVSTGKYYAPKIKSLLGLYGLSHSLYWLLGIPLCLYASVHPLHSLSIALPAAFLLRLFLYWINAACWYRQLNEKKLLLFYPLGDCGWAMYNVLLSPYILWKNKLAWK